MIRTFAIKPDAIKDPDVSAHFRYFGFDKGRVIGAVPEAWEADLMRALSEIDPSKESRIRIHLEELKKQGAIQRVPVTAKTCSWIEVGISTPDDIIQGIIVENKNGHTDKRLLDGNDLATIGSLWDVPSHLIVNKDAKSMAEQVSGFMRYAKTIRFIDPYYSADVGYLSFVKECLGIRSRWPSLSRLCLEFHFLAKTNNLVRDLELIKSGSADEFFRCRDGTTRSIKDKMQSKDSCTFFQWVDSRVNSEERFHERYLLTELGGVEFGGGLRSRPGNEKTSVSLISLQTRESLEKTFSTNGCALTLVRSEREIF